MEVGISNLKAHTLVTPVHEMEAQLFLERIYMIDINTESEAYFKSLLMNPSLDYNRNIRPLTLEEKRQHNINKDQSLFQRVMLYQSKVDNKQKLELIRATKEIYLGFAEFNSFDVANEVESLRNQIVITYLKEQEVTTVLTHIS